ncbi:MAG: penicillin-binding protein 2 [Candidatus Marinimicrobia bacterium]|nr:penicillin-binding protein 2 [Candidatus Neomarinimicrobiota bacterium]
MLKTDNQIPKSRLYASYAVISLIIMVLIVRFFQIQILKYETFSKKSDINRIRAISLSAPRGLILDRNGTILVDNYPTFILNAIPGEILNKNESFMRISECTGLDVSLLLDNYQKYYRTRFVPVRLAKDLTLSQISVLEEHRLDLTGIHYDQFPERVFPSKIRGSHFLGYVKEVNRDIYEKLDNNQLYEFGDLIGWQGVEKIYENELKGQKGVKYLEVNAFGQVMGNVAERMGERPIPGNNIHLTIDSGLQGLLEQSMQGKRGVVIVSDANNGDILAYISAPDYPPDLFTGITHDEDWNDILTNPDRPLMDRNSGGLYPPGSILKMITLLALAEKGNLNTNFSIICTGEYAFGDRVFRCWNEYGHGNVDLRRALSESCNIYFYKIVQALKIDEWAEVAKELGFGEKVGIDLPTEQKGNVPTKEYMNKRYGRYGWSKGAMLNLALGQGDVVVTPIQIAQYVNILATRGITQKLHFGTNHIQNINVTPHFKASSWELIDRLMKGVIYDAGGTGKSADPKIEGLVLAGKTGTAQNPHGEDHAWFVGYGKKGEQVISATVLIENGGHGGQFAAPIARVAFNYVFQPSQIVENQ